MKEILLNFWKSVVKLILSKTTLDEKIAAKVNEIDAVDEPKVEEPVKKQQKEKLKIKNKKF
jgi:hypothetical protein